MMALFRRVQPLGRSLQPNMFQQQYVQGLCTTTTNNTSVSEEKILADNEDDRNWARSFASKSLNEFTSKPPPTFISAENTTDYIKQRGFADLLHIKPAARMLSATLSFPLTLAYAMSYVYDTQDTTVTTTTAPYSGASPQSVPENINILVVGARAESSLPLQWWKEHLFYCSSSSSSYSHRIGHRNIRFVGPGLLPHQALDKLTNTASFMGMGDEKRPQQEGGHGVGIGPAKGDTPSACSSSTNDGYLCTSLSLLNSFTQNPRNNEDVMPLHLHAEKEDLLRWADVFVLFNPGYGTRILGNSWRPTIELLIQSNKPVVCTAHGPWDLQRDLLALDSIVAPSATTIANEQQQKQNIELGWLLKPQLNPFRTLKLTVDTNEEDAARIVTNSHSLYIFRGETHTSRKR